MSEEQIDDKPEGQDNPSDSSTDKDTTLPDGEGSEKNDGEEVTLTKGEWEQTQTELKSIKQALKLEREKSKLKGLSEKKEDNLDKPAKPDEFEEKFKHLREKEFVAERLEYEAAAKQQILKRFEKLQADNDFGIDLKVINAYQDLLEGRTKRGNYPRTREAVFNLLEQAVKMEYPDLYVAELKRRQEEGTDYSGVGGISGDRDDMPKQKLNPKEKAFLESVDNFLKARKPNVK